MTKRILLIRTGGTIDAKSYDDPKAPPRIIETLKQEESLVISVIGSLPNNEYVDNHIWGVDEEKRFVKDSNLFTPEDIKYLAEMIENDQEHDHFILTHGTDEMVKNAIALGREMQSSSKTVVFVGSVVPLCMIGKHKCNGEESLCFVLGHIHKQSPGVYVTGNDANTEKLSFFAPESVCKDRKKSLAESALVLVSR